jgi:hypothetical protein
LFDLETKGLGLSYASIEEKAEKLLEATNFWHSKQRETCVYLPTEDVAMWFLVSTPSDFDCCQNDVSTSSHHDVQTAKSWRLALSVKNSIVFGSPLDPRCHMMFPELNIVCHILFDSVNILFFTAYEVKGNNFPHLFFRIYFFQC